MLPTRRASSKRAVRNGVRKWNARARAQDFKSERANARVNAQMRKWGAGVNAQGVSKIKEKLPNMSLFIPVKK